MIITGAVEVKQRDIGQYAWSGLRRFQNVATVQRLLMELHRPPESQRNNVRKQATQIRHCLLQAHEYWDAAQQVSIATKPVLIYYSIMSLALAEILLKQDGRSSLDMARAHNAHHGLNMTGADSVRPDSSLGATARALRARPQIGPGGNRYGTFDLWHTSSRETPIAGTHTEVHQGGNTVRLDVLLEPQDQAFPPMPPEGVSLCDIFRALPCMGTHMGGLGALATYSRATVTASFALANKDRRETTLVFHPASQAIMRPILDQCLFDAKLLEQINVTELPNALILKTHTDLARPAFQGTYPNGTQLSKTSVWFWSENNWLNEFGLFYLAFFILGNYARYFPDKWMLDVEASSEIAVATMDLLAAASERVPLLALSEMSRRFHVPE